MTVELRRTDAQERLEREKHQGYPVPHREFETAPCNKLQWKRI